jgi:WD40 repeat protein
VRGHVTHAGGTRGLRRFLRPSGLIDLLFGYDIFISYARRDASAYVVALRAELERLGYRCFVDTSDLPPGDQLGPALTRALRRSSVLVVVGSAGALESTYVPQEVSVFGAERPLGTIMPISIGRTLDDSDPGEPLRTALADRVWISETDGALAGKPSDAVFTEVRRRFTFTRRDAWRLRIMTAVALTLVLLVVVAFAMFYGAREARIVAERERAIAQREAKISDARRLAAQATEALSERPQLALLLAVEAVNMSRANSNLAMGDAETALRQALQRTGGIALRAWHDARTWTEIERVALSPDSRWAVGIRALGGMPLWDLSARDPSERVGVRGDPQKAVGAAAFSRDSRTLLIGQESAVLEVELDGVAGGRRKIIDVDGSINRLVPTSGRRWLAVCTGTFQVCQSASVVDLEARPPRATALLTAEFTQPIPDIFITPDDHWLIAGRDKNLHVWDLTKADPSAHHQILDGRQHDIESLALSGDGKWLVAGGFTEVSVWQITPDGVRGPPRVLPCDHCPLVSRVAVSHDGRRIAASGSINSEIPVWFSFLGWELEGNVEHHLLRAHAIGVNDLAVSPDGRWLATAGRDGTGRLWDLTASSLEASVLAAHEGEVSSIVFSTDGRWILTGSDDASVHLWPVGDRRVVGLPQWLALPDPSAYVHEVAISADRSLLVTMTSSSAMFWDLRTEPPTRVQPELAILRPPDRAALSSDRAWLLLTGMGSGSQSLLWDLRQPGAAPAELSGPTARVEACAISPDSRWAVIASDDEAIHVWDLHATTPAATARVLKGHDDVVRDIAFDASGRWMVTASRDGTARRWDMHGADPATSSVMVANHGRDIEDGLAAVAVTVDGARVITGDYGGRVQVWDLQSPRKAALHVLRGHDKPIAAVAVAADPHTVASADEEGTIIVWSLRAGEPGAGRVIMRGRSPLRDMVIDAEERSIVTYDGDAIHLWYLDADALIASARAITMRNMTRAEWVQYFPERPYRKTFADLPALD